VATTPRLAELRVYREAVLDETAVHSLEHGAVWITYRPDLAPDDVERLEMLTNGQTHILLSPYPDLTSPIAAHGARSA
jgi:hypothetical protein